MLLWNVLGNVIALKLFVFTIMVLHIICEIRLIWVISYSHGNNANNILEWITHHDMSLFFLAKGVNEFLGVPPSSVLIWPNEVLSTFLNYALSSLCSLKCYFFRSQTPIFLFILYVPQVVLCM